MKLKVLNFIIYFFLILGCASDYNESLYFDQNHKIDLSIADNAQGGDVGNGGFLVLKNKKYFFLDYFLMQNKYSSSSYFDFLAIQRFKAFNIGYLALRNLSFIDARFSDLLYFEMDCFRDALRVELKERSKVLDFESNKNILDPLSTITKLNSMQVKNICKNCIIDLAVYFKPKKVNRPIGQILTYAIEYPKSLHEYYYFERDTKYQHQYCSETGNYQINFELVKQLDEKNLAALIIHEAVWAYLVRNNYKLTGDTNILALTQFIYKIPNIEILSAAEVELFKEEFLTILDNYEQI